MFYFDILPLDLFPPLFTYFSPIEVLKLLHVPYIQSLLSRDKILTKTLWRRDISTLTSIPENFVEKYQEIFAIFDKLSQTNGTEALDYVIRNTYDVLLHLIVDKNRRQYENALMFAAEHRHMFVFDQLNVPNNVYFRRSVFSHACLGGDISIVEKILSDVSGHEISNYDEAALHAAYGGHKRVLEYLMRLTPDELNHDNIMAMASANGHSEIVNMMLDCGATDYNRSLVNAAQFGHEHIVRLMIEKGANRYDRAMAQAAFGGHKNMVNLMLRYGATAYNKALMNAIVCNHIDIVELMLKIAPKINYNKALAQAHNEEIKNLIKSYFHEEVTLRDSDIN